jgi:ABC-type multidrug transport system fused ATPase/permease subunit
MNSSDEQTNESEQISIEDWYKLRTEFQREEVKKNTKYLFGGLKIYRWYIITVFVVIVLYLVIFVAAFLSDFSSRNMTEVFESLRESEGKIIVIITVFLVNFSISFFVYLLCLEKINQFKLLKQNNLIFQFGNNKILNIRNSVKVLCEKMTIDFSRIKFWGALNSNTFPSIEEDIENNFIDILIPCKFISYFESSPNEGEAILAHELGHILQNDTDIYLKAEAYFGVVRNVFLPLVSINAVCHLILFFYLHLEEMTLSSFFLFSLLVFDASVIYYLTKGFDKLKETHKESERLADAAAVIYSDGFSLINVLNAFNDSQHNSNSIHPSIDDRITSIKEFYPADDV